MREERTMRPQSPGLEEILGKKWQVLDDGFIRVVDYLGCDASVVQAARVSYGAGTKSIQEDASLIRYLMRHAHTTPFEMCELKLHVRAPMDVWRQWVRHRTANVNEYSTRYSVAIDSALKTPTNAWRLQDQSNRQGSGGFLNLEAGTKLTVDEADFHKSARNVYEARLEVGVSREQARKDLPLSTYTEAYWKIDLHNLLSFLRLRMHDDAQYEIRTYANLIGFEIVSRWCPSVWAAFLDYAYNSILLSAREIEILNALQRGDLETAKAHALEYGWIDSRESANKSNRERREALSKFERLGINVPWLVA
jgi:thymidylate synthase (FAD)